MTPATPHAPEGLMPYPIVAVAALESFRYKNGIVDKAIEPGMAGESCKEVSTPFEPREPREPREGFISGSRRMLCLRRRRLPSPPARQPLRLPDRGGVAHRHVRRDSEGGRRRGALQ